MTAAQLLADGTIKAAGLILMSRGIANPSKMGDEAITNLINAIKATLLENLTEILKEWEAAIEARMSEAWLREMMNGQCNDMAMKALQRAGMLEAA